MSFRARESSHGHIDGAKLVFGSASTVVIGEAGRASSLRDSADAFDINFTGTLTANIATSGVNGLDTGVEAASTWYAVHVIHNFTTATTASLLSLSATAPTLPSGYDAFRRVGWVRNDSSSDFLRFLQRGNARNRFIFYDISDTVAQVLSGGNSTTFADVSCTSRVPSTAKDVQLQIAFTPKAVNCVARIRVKGSTVANPILTFFSPAANKSTNGFGYIATDDAQTIQYNVDNALDALDIYVMGYLDPI